MVEVPELPTLPRLLLCCCRYALTCCSWFAKDFPRLLAAKAAHSWDPYDVEELRGKTLGVVGYGDIGRCAATSA
jgi:phosphoglycerate dehydrogenase-like enzyme